MYLNELRINLRPLMAACVGMALGSAMNFYTMSLFAPELIREFGWSKSEYALVGSIPLINVVLVPIAGWFIDRFGMRLGAIIGFTVLPLAYLGFAAMRGNILVFFGIVLLINTVGGLTSTLVFCRITVEKFDIARGIALSLIMSASPLGGAIAAPLIGLVIDDAGWRAGYVTLAALSFSGGMLAIFMMGRPPPQAARELALPSKVPSRKLVEFLRDPLFALIMAAMFLVNLPQAFASSQLKLIVMDNGISSAAGTWMISLYATGVIVGRMIAGFSLDRFPTHLVALASLGLPAIGYVIFAAHLGSAPLLGFGVVLIGLAQGTEGDIGAYLISRRFDLTNFSLLLSLLTSMIGGGSAIGALILSGTLKVTGSYNPFLLVAAVTTLAGAALFGMTGAPRFHRHQLLAAE